MTDRANRFVVVMRGPERRGIVARVATHLADDGFTITESSQYHDPSTDTFFMRIVFRFEEGEGPSAKDVSSRFAAVAAELGMAWEVHDLARRPKVLLMVSKFGHCLHDLVYRWKSGLLPIDIVAVVSNHEDMRPFVEFHGLPYHHLPVTKEAKSEQEAILVKIIEETRTDLVVLARYMQVLSDHLSRYLSLRCINIHHSFLPSFKGAKPYHQAHARGVKMIGATAHFVTADLDEGPIIHQDTRAVDHSFPPEQLVALGQEVEAAVLSRAVTWFAEHRVISNGAKTVVFR
jgi:formyltetrahydrofolate deformylase